LWTKWFDISRFWFFIFYRLKFRFIIGVVWDYEIQTSTKLKLYILLHNYENLCSCLHKYLFIYLFSMYNYYATTILLPWILHTYKLYQNFWKLKFQFCSQVYFFKLCTFITSCSHQMKVFPKILTLIYIPIKIINK
jgi:hypothetical protein